MNKEYTDVSSTDTDVSSTDTDVSSITSQNILHKGFDKLKQNFNNEFTILRNTTEENIKIIEKSINTNIITTFGIFGSILTFLSLQRQILASICSVIQMISVSLIIGGFLILFVLLINKIFKSIIDNSTSKTKLNNIHVLWILAVLLISVGLLVSLLNQKTENSCKEESYKQLQQYLVERNKDIDKFKEDIQTDLKNYQQTLFELQMKVETLKIKSKYH